MLTTPSEPVQDPDVEPPSPDVSSHDPGPATVKPDVARGLGDADAGNDPRTKSTPIVVSPELLS